MATITGINQGQTTITASYNGKSASKILYVTNASNPIQVSAVSGLKYHSKSNLITVSGAQGAVHYNVGSAATSSSSTTIPTASGRNAGTYTVYWYCEGVTGKYNSASGNIDVTIGKAPVVNATTFSGSTVTYHTTANLTISGYEGGTPSYQTSTDNSTWGTATTTEPSRSTVGTTYVRYKLTPDTNHTNDGDWSTSVALTVNKAEDIDFNVNLTTETYTYNGTARTIATQDTGHYHGLLNYSIGYKKGSQATADNQITWGVSASTTSGSSLTATDGGTYYVYKKYTADSSHSPNLTYTLVGSVTINAATPNTTLTIDATGSVYCAVSKYATSTESEKTINLHGSTSGFKTTPISYVVAVKNSSNKAVTGWTFNGTSITIPASTASGTYTVTVTATSPDSDNYINQSASASTTITIKNTTLSSVTIKTTNVAGAIAVPGLSAGADTVTTTNTTSATAYGSVTLTATYNSGGTRDVTAAGLSYSWTSSANNGISVTNTNAATTSVKSTSRGTTYNSSTRSDTITRTVSYSYTEGGTTKTASTSTTATATQAKNGINYTNTVITVNAGEINNISFGAAGGNEDISSKTAASASVKVYFDSGSYSDSYTTYGTLTSSETFGMTAKTGFSFTSPNVTASSMGTTVTAARSTGISRTTKYTYTLKSAYTGGSGWTTAATGEAAADIKTKSNTASATASQSANNITEITSWGTGSAGAINNISFGAAGGTTAISNKTAATTPTTATVKYSTGDSNTVTLSNIGSWSAISYTYGMTAKTGFSFTSPNVTAANMGTTPTAARSTGISRTANASFTLNSSYNQVLTTAISWTSSDATETASQSANALTGITIKTASAGAIGNVNINAAGTPVSISSSTAATAAANAVVIAKYTSTSTKDVTPASMTYSWSSTNANGMSVTNTNAASSTVTGSSRGTTYSTSTRTDTITRTATYSYTDNGVTKTASTSTTATATQAKNVLNYTNTTITVNAGAINNISFGAAGGTTNITNKTAASASVKVYFDSGSYSDSYTTYGTLSSSETFGMTAKTGFSFDSPAVTADNMGIVETAARSTGISRTTKYTFTLKDAYTGSGWTTAATGETAANIKTKSNTASATASQEKNEVVSLALVLNSNATWKSASDATGHPSSAHYDMTYGKTCTTTVTATFTSGESDTNFTKATITSSDTTVATVE